MNALTTTLTGLLVLLTPRSWACSCVEENTSKATVAQSYKSATIVFVGRVTQAEPVFFTKNVHEKSRFSGLDTTYRVNSTSIASVRYKFIVSRLFKGQAVNSAVVITVRNTSCSTRFVPGTELLIYGSSTDNGAYSEISPDYATSACWRNRHLRFVEPLELQELKRLATLRPTAID